jgi:hypothetical protein
MNAHIEAQDIIDNLRDRRLPEPEQTRDAIGTAILWVERQLAHYRHECGTIKRAKRVALMDNELLVFAKSRRLGKIDDAIHGLSIEFTRKVNPSFFNTNN